MPEPASPAIRIDTLALRLPAGFERRAARIGRLTAEALATVPPAMREASIAGIRVDQRGVRPNWSDERVAMELAQAIRQRIDGGQR